MKAILVLLTLLLTVPGRAATCSSEATARLLAAGVDSASVDRYCKATMALTTQGLLLQVHPSFVDEFAHALLPIAVTSLNRYVVLNLTDAVYCGAANAHTGSFLATATQWPTTNNAPKLTQADCSVSLESLAQRVATTSEPPGYAVAARLEETWTPWELTMHAVSVSTRNRSGDRPPEADRIEEAVLATDRPLQQVSVAAVPLLQATDPHKPLEMAAIFYFNPTNIALTGVLAASHDAVNDADGLPPYAALTESFDGSPGNVTLVVTYEALNYAGSVFFAGRSVPIQAASPFLSVDLDGVSMSGDTDSLTIDMQGAVRNDRYTGRMTLTGNPLKIQKVDIDAVCTVVDQICSMRRQLADLTGKAVTQALGAKPWNPNSRDQQVPIPWGASNVALSGQIKQIIGTKDGLIIHNHFILSKATAPGGVQ